MKKTNKTKGGPNIQMPQTVHSRDRVSVFARFMLRVRQLPTERGGRIPAVALTAYARTEDRLKALRAGYQMHMPKPIEYAELLTVMATLGGRQ
jgi:CheY-like chemotaxis protein